MRFLKNFVKNKVLVLSVCVIVVSLVYTGVQKAIDNYNFNRNNELIVDENSDNTGDEHGVGAGGHEGDLDDSDGVFGSESDVNEDGSDGVAEGDGQIDEEETNLELEGSSEGNDEKNGLEAEISGVDASKGEGEGALEKSKIYVYITGEVNVPGVVVLNEGSRIVDAINAAGGTTAKADISKVNLVYVLDDGMKVNIPNSNDLKNNPDFEYITMNSGDGGNDDYYGGSSSSASGSGSGASGGTGGGVSGQGSSRSGSSGSSKRYDVVNINTASQTELETLPGIGPSLALKIINYRKENGKFSSIEQIKDVSGIGESKFEILKKYITI